MNYKLIQLYVFILPFLRKSENKQLWKLEYFDTVYKIYDWDKNLTGYFFPNYNLSSLNNKDNEKALESFDFDEETNVIDKLNKEKQKILGGNLMLPLVKLYLLDNEEGIDLDFAIKSLNENAQRAIKWQEWIKNNHREFNIMGNAIYTSREDRNMLSIVLGITSPMILGEKELLADLNHLLNKLHEGELI